MRAPSKIEQENFDRWISWTLAAETQTAHPSKKVWQRIVHRIVNSDETERIAIQATTRQDQSRDKIFRLPSYMGAELYNPFIYTDLTLSIGI